VGLAGVAGRVVPEQGEIKMIKFSIVTLAVLTFLSGAYFLQGEDAVDPTGGQGGRTYTIVARGEVLPADFAQMVGRAGGTLVKTVPAINAAIARSDDPAFVARVEAVDGVEYAHVNLWFRPRGFGNDSTLMAVGEFLTHKKAATMDPPDSDEDDPLYNVQWAAAAIDQVEQRFYCKQRGKGVVVAVVDEGIDTEHPDLADNIDLTNSASMVPGEPVDAIDALPDVELPFFNHGTHVAGTIAMIDNEVGGIGVAPECTILAVKVLSQQLGGCGQFDWVVDGIIYAADNGADVINMSLGGILIEGDIDDNCTPDDTSDDVLMTKKVIDQTKKTMQKAVDYARKRGALMIVAAGNEELDTHGEKDILVLPTELKNVVAVSSTGPLGWGMDQTVDLDTSSFFTNYGKDIDVSAPGGNIDFDLYFAEPWEFCTVGGVTIPCWALDMVVSASPGGYVWSTGTSMAAPHVAGLCALIIGGSNKKLSPSKVESILMKSLDDLGKKGNDPWYGRGRINVDKAPCDAKGHKKKKKAKKKK
jgi:subtilisin family serine protease